MGKEKKKERKKTNKKNKGLSWLILTRFSFRKVTISCPVSLLYSDVVPSNDLKNTYVVVGALDNSVQNRSMNSQPWWV